MLVFPGRNEKGSDVEGRAIVDGETFKLSPSVPVFGKFLV